MKKVIVITGAGRGVGAATALLAAMQDYAVCVNYRDDQQAAKVVVEKIITQGGEAIAVKADVAVASEVVKLFETVDTRLGRITALVNNVGIVAPMTKVEAITTPRLQKIFATNVFSQFYCAQQAIQRMSTKHGGTGGAIVNVSSLAAVLGAANEYVDYAATKGAIDSFTRGLALELVAEGIRVNAVRPGFVQTDIHANNGATDRIEKIKHTIPMQRAGKAKEIAAAILWLLSNEASYVTGSLLDVGGGR
mgnify:CR=1 FL=1